MTGGRGGYGQMTSSKIAQFRDFLYLKKLLAVSVFVTMLKFESIYYYHDLNYIIIHTNLWGDYWYSGTILLHGQIVLHFT